MFKNLQSKVKQIGAGIGILSIAISSVNAQQWVDVGSTGSISAGLSSYNNLAIDAQGNYYVSYYDLSVQKASVQKFNGSAWSYLGGTPGITPGSATFSSLCLDVDGNVYYTSHVPYPGNGMEVRKFAGSWSQLPNVMSTAVSYQASAVSDSNILFTYGNYYSGVVKRFVNGTWQQVGDAGFTGSANFAEMVLGSNNKIYVSCNNTSGLKVYENSTTATTTDNWTLVGGNAVDAASSTEQYTSDLAIDANNNLYVAYVSTSSNGQKLNVKKFDGTSWNQIGTANFSSGRVQHVAIAVTPSGEPYVAASRWENDNMLRNTVYRFNTTAQSWETFGGTFISDNSATYNDVAIDKVNNNLVLTYSDNGIRVKKIQLPNTTPACNNADPGTNPGDTGCVTFTYKGQQVTYTTVRGADGKVWLQQNLGSTQVATSMVDADSYGDLFQWGRWDDGHQNRNSAIANIPSNNSPNGLNGTASFIVGSLPNAWWSSNDLTDQWSASDVSAVTSTKGADPCKVIGQQWKMPSQAEWAAAVNAEAISNPATAYNSKLKLPAGGNRSFTDGAFVFVGQRGYFWSSDASSSGGKFLYVGSTIANPSSGASRGQGSSVRCIKDVTTGLGTSDIKRSSIGIYPNPTNGILNIKTDSDIDKVNVTNVVGQKMNVQFSNNTVNMQQLQKGVYIVELQLKNGQKISKKVIKN
ncbi:T9SS type A sorting domain-containing protein [Chryseobacterium sp. 2TAF14]|uniref:T9SS type A sorting domain-containing protein n=1 Tax=Chryseobacterium sp. 2TAF14 TaxID=3233007 RepID=UPI003F9289B5